MMPGKAGHVPAEPKAQRTKSVWQSGLSRETKPVGNYRERQ